VIPVPIRNAKKAPNPIVVSPSIMQISALEG
jgi:hypothetical protein